jgi:hypothetical protein
MLYSFLVRDVGKSLLFWLMIQTGSWDNNGVNHYKMGHRDLATDAQKCKIINAVWTTNRVATIHIPGREPIQTQPSLGPAFWIPVKDLDIRIVKSCFEDVTGYLNSTLPGKPTLSDLYLGAVGRFIKGSYDHEAWQRSSDYNYRPLIAVRLSGGLGIKSGATQFRVSSERVDIFENKEFRHGTVKTLCSNAQVGQFSIDNLIQKPEIIESNLPSVLLNPGKMECRLALLQA